MGSTCMPFCTGQLLLILLALSSLVRADLDYAASLTWDFLLSPDVLPGFKVEEYEYLSSITREIRSCVR